MKRNDSPKARNGKVPFGQSLVALVLMVAPLFAGAQSAGGNYVITEHTIDNGGGRSSGGNFVVTGTIGQADAQTSGAGAFLVEGGFWHGSAQIAGNLFRDGFET